MRDDTWSSPHPQRATSTTRVDGGPTLGATLASPADAARAEALRRFEERRVREELRARMFGASTGAVRVDRFEVRQRLGEGATGIVYAAFDPKLRREVALKLLAARPVRDDELLLHEARALARLSHPNVLPVYEVGVSDGVPFIVSELVSGGTLRAWLATSPPPSPAAVLEVLLGIGRGLGAAHERGLTHRDIKPENVLVGADGRPRVADFGLALGSQRGPGELGTSPLAGTPRYMAPEQLAGQHVDPLSDQFAYAVLCFEALFGVRPYEGATVGELLAAMRAGDVARVDERHPHARALPALRRALALDPHARFPTTAALVAELARLGAPRPTRGLAWLGGGVALAGVLGVALSLAWASRDERRPRSSDDTQGRANDERVAATSASPRAPPSAASPRTAPSTAPSTASREQELATRATSLTVAGQWRECATLLAAERSPLLLPTRVSCARMLHDREPAWLEAACDDAEKVLGPKAPEDCDRTLRKARAHAGRAEHRACAEVLLSAPPKRAHLPQLAVCVGQTRDLELYQRQCRYSVAAGTAPPTSDCDAMGTVIVKKGL